MKLYYFASPGRAELSRMMFGASETAFEDVRFDRAAWDSEYKAKSPTGQCPFLELDDGSMLTQTSAISMYVAKVTGFLPSDDLKLARCVELMSCFEDLMPVLMPTFSIQDLDEKIASRKALMAPEGGKMYAVLATVEKMIGQAATKFYLGDEITLADFAVFSNVSMLISGGLDGIDKTSMAPFPSLLALRDKVAAHPKVAAYYADKGDLYAAYR